MGGDTEVTPGERLRNAMMKQKQERAMNSVDMLPEQFNDDITKGPIVGKKLDAGKPPVIMGVLNYFPNALLAVAAVSEYGAKKYKLSLADKNWMRVPDGRARYTDALGRHVVYEAIDPKDEESGLYHDQMAAWNALARLELRIRADRDKVGSIPI